MQGAGTIKTYFAFPWLEQAMEAGCKLWNLGALLTEAGF